MWPAISEIGVLRRRCGDALLVGGALGAGGRRDCGTAEQGWELGEWRLGGQAVHACGRVGVARVVGQGGRVRRARAGRRMR
jgi:hypothetical protein